MTPTSSAYSPQASRDCVSASRAATRRVASSIGQSLWPIINRLAGVNALRLLDGASQPVVWMLWSAGDRPEFEGDGHSKAVTSVWRSLPFAVYRVTIGPSLRIGTSGTSVNPVSARTRLRIAASIWGVESASPMGTRTMPPGSAQPFENSYPNLGDFCTAAKDPLFQTNTTPPSRQPVSGPVEAKPSSWARQRSKKFSSEASGSGGIRIPPSERTSVSFSA